MMMKMMMVMMVMMVMMMMMMLMMTMVMMKTLMLLLIPVQAVPFSNSFFFLDARYYVDQKFRDNVNGTTTAKTIA